MLYFIHVHRQASPCAGLEAGCEWFIPLYLLDAAAGDTDGPSKQGDRVSFGDPNL